MPEEIRVLIADDHAMFRDALRRLLHREKGFRVVGEAGDGAETVELAAKLQPDVILLDLSMPRMSGLAVLQQLQDLSIDVRTIVLTAEIQSAQLVEAVRLGARGIILKDMATQLLFKGMRSVMAGEYWIGHEGMAGIVESLRTAPATPREAGKAGKESRLSARELEIVTAIVEGCTNRDIARNFSLSEQTVKHHLTKIFSKLGVSNRLELAIYAMQHRLTD